MKVFVLLYNPNSDNEGIHSIELKGRTIVLVFEEKDDAERYVGLLEAQDFPVPSVEKVNLDEIKDFCDRCDYETRIVTKDFVPKTLEGHVTLQVPPKSSTGRLLRLKGRGLVHGNDIGDQYVEIVVVIPANMNDEEISLYSRLQELSLSEA